MTHRMFSVNGRVMRFDCADWKMHTEQGIVDVGNTYGFESVVPFAASLGQPLTVTWERPDGTKGELFPNGPRVEVTEGMQFTVRQQHD